MYATILAGTLSLDGTIIELVDQAVGAEMGIERHYWLCAVVDQVAMEPSAKLHRAYERIAQRFHTAYRLPHDERQQAIVWMAERLLPVT